MISTRGNLLFMLLLSNFICRPDLAHAQVGNQAQAGARTEETSGGKAPARPSPASVAEEDRRKRATTLFKEDSPEGDFDD